MKTVPQTPEQEAAYKAVLAAQSHGNANAPPARKASTSDPDGSGQPLVIVGIHELLTIKLPTRKTLLAPWLLSQSLSMVYAWRGVGKTHVALGIAYAVSSAGKFLNWEANDAHKVLYIDGEMPGAALQNRLASIVTANDKEPEPGFLSIITPDLQHGFMPDLATYEGQEEIDAAVESTGAELIIIDNLSCLVRRGGRENDAESWNMVSEWGLSMRAQGKSVLFIHHAGKGGQQRGTSKREDLLDTVISLKRPPDYCPTDGAVFEVHYEKARNLSGDETSPFEAKLTQDQHGGQVWTWRPLEESTLDRVVELANEGLSQRDIANELGINQSSVSRAYRKAESLGLLAKKPSGRGRNQSRDFHGKGGQDD